MGCINQLLSGYGLPSVQQREEEVTEQVNGVKDLAINTWRKGIQEGMGRKRTMFRVIELTPSGPLRKTHLAFLDVEECQL